MTRPAHAINKLKNDQANSLDVLELVKSPSSSAAGNSLTITLGANATGDGVVVTHAGTGPSLNIASTNARGDIHFSNRSSDPATTTKGDLWFNSTSNVFKYYDGTTTQTFGTAGGSLDDAYDSGATITVDAGAVIFDGDSATAGSIFEIQNEPGSTQVTTSASITHGANATGNSLLINHSGAGAAMRLLHTGSGGNCLEITHAAGNTSADAVSISSASTANTNVLSLTSTSTVQNQPMLQMTNSGLGTYLNMTYSGSAGGGGALSWNTGSGTYNSSGISLTMGSASLNATGITVTKSPGASQSGRGMAISLNSNCTSDGIFILQDGSGSGSHGIFIDHGATGDCDALRVQMTSGTLAQGLVITTSAATNAVRPTVLIDQTSGTGGQYLIKLEKTPSGSATGGGLEINCNSNVTGSALLINNDGSDHTVEIIHSGQGTGVNITMGSLSGGRGLGVDHSGEGPGVYVAHTGAGNGAEILKDATVTSGICLKVINNGDNNSNVVEIKNEPASASSGITLELDNNSFQSGNVLSIPNNGSGNAIDIGQTGAGDAINVDIGNTSGKALVITDSAALSGPAIQLTLNADGVGAGIAINKIPATGAGGNAIDIAVGVNATASAINVDMAANERAFEATLSGSSGLGFTCSYSNSGGRAAVFTSTGTSAQPVMSLNKSPSSSTGGAAVLLTTGANHTAAALDMNHAGSGRGIDLSVGHASGSGIFIHDDSVDVAGNFFHVQINDDSTGDAIFIDRQPATGAAGDGVSIIMGANATGVAALIANSGTGHGISFTGSDTTPTRADILLTLVTADPSTAVEGSLWYNTTNNVLRFYDGTSVQDLPGSGGGSLDAAYNNGSTITVDSGAVVYAQTTATNAIEITQAGSGDALNIDLTSDTAAQAIVVTSSVASTVDVMSITANDNAASGTVLKLTKSPGAFIGGNVLHVIAQGSNTSTAVLVQASSAGASAHGIQIIHTGTGSGARALDVNASPGSSAAVTGCRITSGTNTSGASLNIINDGTGAAIAIAQTGTTGSSGGSIVVSIQNTSASATAIRVTETVATTAVAVEVVRTTVGATGANMLLSRNFSSATAGNCLEITLDADSSGNGIDLLYAGTASAIDIDLQSTGGNAIVIADSFGANTAPMITMTRSVFGTTGDMFVMTKSPSSSTAGKGIEITFGSNTTEALVSLINSGSAHGVDFTGGDTTPTRADILFTLCSSDPSTAVEGSLWYNTTNNVLRFYDGTSVQDLPGGGEANSLDTAYDNGSTIAVDTGAIAITKTATGVQALDILDSSAGTVDLVRLRRNFGAATGVVLSVEKSPASSTSGSGMYLLMGANSTGIGFEVQMDGSGNAIDIDMTGSGDALNIALGTSTSSQALVISSSVASTSSIASITSSTTGAIGELLTLTKSPSTSTAGNMMSLTMGSNTTGIGLSIDANGSGTAISVLQPGGIGFLVSESATATSSDYLVRLQHNVAGTAVAPLLYATCSPSSSGGPTTMGFFQAGSNMTGRALHVDNNGSGDGILIGQDGAGDALRITLSSSTSAQALVITTDVSTTNPLVSIDTGTGASSNLISLSVDGSGNGLDIDQSGAGNAIDIALDSNTGAQALVVSETVAGTADAIDVTRSATSTGDGIAVTMTNGATGAAFRATGQAGSAKSTLVDAATIATDCADGNVFQVILAGNRTLGAPTNAISGFTYVWVIKQDATGTRTLAYNAVFDFPGGTAPVLSTGANGVDVLCGVYDGSNFLSVMNKDFS